MKKLYHRDGTHYRGYAPALDSKIDSENNGDLLEGFIIGQEEWVPKENDVKKVDVSIATSLQNPPDFVKPSSITIVEVRASSASFPLHLISLKHTLMTNPKGDCIVGINARSDFERFTLLWQELQNSEKPWINAPLIPRTLVINIDGLLAQCTITLSDRRRLQVDRIWSDQHVKHSIAMLVSVDPHVQIELIQSHVSPERPPMHELIFAEDVRTCLNES
ncbi:hypothetical protein EDC04DRAFT_2894987 [Pisolithus marmoratus]|nr:hypothetical protein EDC04DRAFT_2894987 [Pisolithus marmoratus]